MKDFIHGALVKAASTDGIETMLKGAGIGAGANVGIGAVQGDFDVIGNAFSGAALGGIGGAAMKYGANRYAGNLLKQADGIAEAGSKKVGMFTNPGENHALSFMGGDDNTERFAKMAAAGAFDGKGYSAGAAKEAAEVGVQDAKKSPKASANPEKLDLSQVKTFDRNKPEGTKGQQVRDQMDREQRDAVMSQKRQVIDSNNVNASMGSGSSSNLDVNTMLSRRGNPNNIQVPKTFSKNPLKDAMDNSNSPQKKSIFHY